MLCKWCGMESETTDACSWCHRPFPVAEQESPEPDDAAEAPAAEPLVPHADQDLPADTGPDEPKAPWTINPPPPPPAAPVSPPLGGSNASGAPIIGVRRREGSGDLSRIPAPGLPPQWRAPGGPASVSRADPPASTATSAPAPPPPRADRPSRPAPPTAYVPPRAGAQPLNREPSIPDRPVAGTPPAGDTASGRSSRVALPSSITGGGRINVSEIVRGAAPDAAETGESTRLEAEPTVEHAGNGRAEHNGLPDTGGVQLEKSKYYSGQVIDTISGTHYDSETGQALSGPVATAEPEAIEEERPGPFSEFSLLTLSVGVAAAVVAFVTVFTFAHPSYYGLPLALGQFLGAMALPLLRMVPWAEEDSDDVAAFVLLTVVFGPFIGLILYGAICLVRWDTNPAVLGCLAIGVIARLSMEGALYLALPNAYSVTISQLAPFTQVTHWSITSMLVNWSPLAALAGWYFASMFRHLDE